MSLNGFAPFFLSAPYNRCKESFEKPKKGTQCKLSFVSKRKAIMGDPTTSQGEVVCLSDQQPRKMAKSSRDSNVDSSELELEEYICRQKKWEAKIREAKTPRIDFGSWKEPWMRNLGFHANCSPKKDAKTNKLDEQSPNYELGKDMWKQ